MDRKEFLSVVGVGTAAIACSYCFGGCKTDNGITNAPANVDFTLDLANPVYAALKSVGGYFYNGGVIVAHTTSGYVAVSQTCTHAEAQVIFDASNIVFYCPAHGSIFAKNGSVQRGPAGSALVSYKTTLSGTSLRVYS